MARPPSGRLALAVFLVALVAVAAAAALPALLAATGWGPRPAPAGAAVDRAHAAHAAAQRERLARLSLAARLLAGERALGSVLRGGGGAAVDGRAALADLLAQRRPGLGFDLAVVLDREGRVVAASEGAAVAPGDDLATEPPVAAALADGEAALVWRTGGGLAHVAVEPVAPDFELLGHVLVGAAIDQVFALEVARASGAGVTFAAVTAEGLVPVASSLGDAAAAELVAALAAAGEPLAAALDAGETREAARVEVAGRARRAMAVPLAAAAGAPPAGAAVLSAEAGAAGLLDAVLPLAAGAAAGLLLALLLAPFVARRALSPAARLAEAVEAAPRESFARRLEPRRYRALAPLAAALDRLFRGLHEERSLAAVASAARRRLPAVAGTAGGGRLIAERGAVALFDLRRYASLGEDPQPASDHSEDLERLRQSVAAAGGRLEAVAGHRALARFSGDEAAWRAVTAAAGGLAAVAAGRSSFDEGDAAAAAVASGRLVRRGDGAAGAGTGSDGGAGSDGGTGSDSGAGSAGGTGGAGGAALLVGPAVQLAESVLRETAPGDLAMSRAVHREIADRLAAHGAKASEQRGLLSPQPLFVLDPAAVAGLAAAGAGAVPSAGAPAAGARVAGRYEVLRQEGSSAGAELWRVRDREAGREAALKWLPRTAEGAGAAGLDGPLERARRLDHPGLAGIDAVGEAGEGVFLVRDWVDGVPLSRLGDLPAPAALGLARQLAAALAAAHGEGLAHGRLKPENVLVDVEGRARLVDLGVAAVAGPAASASAGDRLLAPEQRGGAAAGGAGDARTDVYALGTLIHRLVLGRWPGDAATDAQTVPVPAGLEPILARATAEEPERRYADAGELAAALEGVAV